MSDTNKRNLVYFENPSMHGLYACMEEWQQANSRRLLSISVQQDGGNYCCEDEAFTVKRTVDALVLAAEVVAPVGVEVAAGGEGAELEDGLGAFESPSRACYVHSVLDDVAACSHQSRRESSDP